MNRREFIKAGVVGGASVMSNRLFAADSTKNRQPNILWIMMDDGRADTLGCYGRNWARTLHMDVLATNGVRFETAIVQNPVCVPSRKSMKSDRKSTRLHS